MRAAVFLAVLGSTIVSAQSPFLSQAQRAHLHGEASAPAEPFRVVGNIYFVGAKEIGCYLITTPEGHILLDTGTNEMQPMLRANIEKLGFKLQDIKIILSSHAHFDHTQGHAAMKRATGAQVMALGGDAVALESGKDNSALGDEGSEPVKVDRVLQHKDSVSLGGTTMTAIWTGGHTQGATMWLTTVQDKGKTYSIAFRGAEIPNSGVPLFNNPRHPNVVADTQRTLRTLRELPPPDIYLSNHPANQFAGKLDRLKAGETPNPLVDPAVWTNMITNAEKTFAYMLKEAEAEEKEQAQYLQEKKKTSAR